LAQSGGKKSQPDEKNTHKHNLLYLHEEQRRVPCSEPAGIWETATAFSWNSFNASMVDADIRDLQLLDAALLFRPNIRHNILQIPQSRMSECGFW